LEIDLNEIVDVPLHVPHELLPSIDTPDLVETICMSALTFRQLDSLQESVDHINSKMFKGLRKIVFPNIGDSSYVEDLERQLDLSIADHVHFRYLRSIHVPMLKHSTIGILEIDEFEDTGFPKLVLKSATIGVLRCSKVDLIHIFKFIDPSCVQRLEVVKPNRRKVLTRPYREIGRICARFEDKLLPSSIGGCRDIVVKSHASSPGLEKVYDFDSVLWLGSSISSGDLNGKYVTDILLENLEDPVWNKVDDETKTLCDLSYCRYLKTLCIKFTIDSPLIDSPLLEGLEVDGELSLCFDKSERAKSARKVVEME